MFPARLAPSMSLLISVDGNAFSGQVWGAILDSSLSLTVSSSGNPTFKLCPERHHISNLPRGLPASAFSTLCSSTVLSDPLHSLLHPKPQKAPQYKQGKKQIPMWPPSFPCMTPRGCLKSPSLECRTPPPAVTLAAFYSLTLPSPPPPGGICT